MWAQRTIFDVMKEMIRELVSMTEQEWGTYAFSRDPIHKRVSTDLRREMIQSANRCGREEAQKLQKRFGQQDITQLVAALGLNINREDSFGVDNFITFAQFHSPNSITLFMGNVTATQDLILEHDMGEMLQYVDVEQLLTAHEMFHFIEEETPTLYTRTTRIDLWGVGRLRYKSGLICLGEIAAMAFAAEMLHLNYSPYVFDVLLPWSKNEIQSRKLYQDILQFKNVKGEEKNG